MVACSLSRSLARRDADFCRRRAAMLLFLSHRTNASFSCPKLTVAALAASVQQHHSKAPAPGRWEAKVPQCPHGQPPARFGPAAAVCRLSYLVLGDMAAVRLALYGHHKLTSSDCAPLTERASVTGQPLCYLPCCIQSIHAAPR